MQAAKEAAERHQLHPAVAQQECADLGERDAHAADHARSEAVNQAPQ
jgi:hypothetical protein